jgi:replicative DNA helicase
MSSKLESRVISALLKDKQIHLILQSSPDIIFRTHKDIWEFVRDYSEKNLSVPPASVLKEKFEDFVVETDVGSTKHHLEELKAGYLSDSLESILFKTANKLSDRKPIDALNTIISDTSQLKKITADVRDLDVINVEDAIEYFKQVQENIKRGTHGIKTNLKGFDSFLPAGISKGHFGILMAYPSIGKSWLSVYMAVEAWKSGKKPLIISLEMTESEVRNRIYTIMGKGKWSHRKLSAGEIDIQEFDKWGSVYLNNMSPFYVVSTDGTGEITPAVIRAKIDQYGPDIVFVDYIQLMQPNTKTDNEVVRIKNISRELKVLAVSEGVPIVAIASATPDDVTDMSSPPSLGQVAWSKQLAYDADFVLSLGRSQGSNILTCVFRKNRHGFLGEFIIDIDFDSGKFVYKEVKI